MTNKKVQLDYEILQQGKGFTLHCLFKDGEEIYLPCSTGPGMWYRAIQDLKAETGKSIDPAEFGEAVEALYYYYKRSELRRQPEKMERLGFFECPKCRGIYSKWMHENSNLCDNCLAAQC